MGKSSNIMYIKDEFVTLGQLVKHFHLVQTGGEVKFFLVSHDIKVNGEAENRRGKKLRPGDEILIDNQKFEVCMSSN